MNPKFLPKPTFPSLIVYGHEYCPQARILVRVLAKQQIDHEWRDVVRGQPHFKDELKNLANGHLSVPTVIFPDGTVLVEPWPNQVLNQLGLSSPGWLDRLLTKFKRTLSTFIKMLILTLALLLGSQLTAAPARAGDPDDLLVKSFGQGFGPNNSAVLDMTTTGARLEKVAYQSTGKYIVVFRRDGELWLTRYHADGRQDMTFGKQNGEVSVPEFFLHSLVIQPDDRILILGPDGNDTYLRRLTPDGLNDQSFSETSHPFRSSRMALQANGQIIVAGATDPGTNTGFFVVSRYNPDGTLDDTFGENGTRTTEFELASGSQLYVADLAITSDDKIIVAGDASPDVLARYLPDGEPDTSLAGTGQASSYAVFDFQSHILVQPDNKIVAAHNDVYRINTTGEPSRDLTFGQDGYAPPLWETNPSANTFFSRETEFCAPESSVNLMTTWCCWAATPQGVRLIPRLPLGPVIPPSPWAKSISCGMWLPAPAGGSSCSSRPTSSSFWSVSGPTAAWMTGAW